MNNQSTPANSKDATPTVQVVRDPEIGAAHKRDRLLQRVRAARKRLTPTG